MHIKTKLISTVAFVMGSWLLAAPAYATCGVNGYWGSECGPQTPEPAPTTPGDITNTLTGGNSSSTATGVGVGTGGNGYGGQGAASATGYQGAASATGYQGAASATGTRGAAIATGPRGRVMGAVDGIDLFARQIVLDGENWICKSIACGTTGKDGIKSGVWYACVDSRLVEVTD